MRKFFCLFSHVVPGLLLIALGYTGCAPILSIALISFSMGSNGAATLTNLVNHQDLAPNYAATLYGIANGIGNTAGFVTPLVTAYFTKNGVSLFVHAYGTGDNPKFRRFSNFILILCMFCAKLRTFFLSTWWRHMFYYQNNETRGPTAKIMVFTRDVTYVRYIFYDIHGRRLFPYVILTHAEDNEGKIQRKN